MSTLINLIRLKPGKSSFYVFTSFIMVSFVSYLSKILLYMVTIFQKHYDRSPLKDFFIKRASNNGQRTYPCNRFSKASSCLLSSCGSFEPNLE